MSMGTFFLWFAGFSFFWLWFAGRWDQFDYARWSLRKLRKENEARRLGLPKPFIAPWRWYG